MDRQGVSQITYQAGAVDGAPILIAYDIRYYALCDRPDVLFPIFVYALSLDGERIFLGREHVIELAVDVG